MLQFLQWWCNEGHDQVIKLGIFGEKKMTQQSTRVIYEDRPLTQEENEKSLKMLRAMVERYRQENRRAKERREKIYWCLFGLTLTLPFILANI